MPPILDPKVLTNSGGFPKKKLQNLAKKLAQLFAEATNFESEKFAEIGEKFCTKYVKIR